MLFKNKYSTLDIKKHYENADKNFNMKTVKTSDKIPDKSVYMTKLFYKLYSVNNKAIEKLKKSKSATHLAEIDSTKGDYSRRKGNIGESVKAMYDWSLLVIKENKDLKYSLFGVFCDTYDNLFNLKWRGAWKVAYNYKSDNVKSLANSFKMMYWSECYLLETLLIKLSMVSYKMYTGLSAEEAVTEIEYQDSAYMDKVVLPGINLNTLISTSKDPLKMIKDYIAGEKQAVKAQENFESINKSEESVFLDTIKKTGGNLIMLLGILVTGITGAVTLIGGGTVVGGIVLITSVIIFIVVLIPTIRSIIYYAYESQVDLVKELELNKEILENNIILLKEKRDRMADGPNKEKLNDIISRQEEYFKKLEEKIAKNKIDGDTCEYSMNNDEHEANEETDESYDDDDDSDGDFSIDI